MLPALRRRRPAGRRFATRGTVAVDRFAYEGDDE